MDILQSWYPNNEARKFTSFTDFVRALQPLLPCQRRRYRMYSLLRDICNSMKIINRIIYYLKSMLKAPELLFDSLFCYTTLSHELELDHRVLRQNRPQSLRSKTFRHSQCRHLFAEALTLCWNCSHCVIYFSSNTIIHIKMQGQFPKTFQTLTCTYPDRIACPKVEIKTLSRKVSSHLS